MSGTFKNKAEYEAALASATTDAEKMDVRLKYAGQIKDEIEEANKKGESETVTRLRLEAAEIKAEMANNKAENLQKEVERVKADQGKTSKSVSKEDNAKDIAMSLKAIKDDGFKGEKTLEINSKAAAGMSTSNLTGQGYITDFKAGLIDILSEPNQMLQAFGTLPTNAGYLTFLEKKNRDGAAAATAELANYSLVDADFVSVDVKMRKITAYLTISDEMLEDTDFATEFVRNELNYQLNKALEAQILSGAATYATPSGENWAGVYTNATTISTTDFALKVALPNELNALRVAAANSRLASGSMIADTIIVHPNDFAKMAMIKSTTGEDVGGVGLSFIGNEAYFQGMKVIQSAFMTQRKFLVCPRALAKVIIRKSITTEIARVNQPVPTGNNVYAVSMRGNVYLPSNHATAFIKGDFDTVITAITKP